MIESEAPKILLLTVLVQEIIRKKSVYGLRHNFATHL